MISKIKIIINDNSSINICSVRVFSYNVFHWFSQLGYDVALNDWNNYSKYDVAIFGKNTKAELIKKAKAQNPKLLCGLIHPSDYSYERRRLFEAADFFIVDAVLEKDYYLKYNPNIFVFPEIEKIFTKTKIHNDHKPIIIGYHGNLDHLKNFPLFLKSALEELNKQIQIKLITVYDVKKLGLWKKSRPDIEVEHVQWGLDTIENSLLRCDIGIVPGLVPISEKSKAFLFNILKLVQSGAKDHKNDYLLRFKNCTNAGRAFVFHQLGIPVISDFMPPSFHILGNPDCGFLAHSEQGWFLALKNLSESATLRQETAQKALEEFSRFYNPLKWSERLYQDIENLWQNTKSKNR